MNPTVVPFPIPVKETSVGNYEKDLHDGIENGHESPLRHQSSPSLYGQPESRRQQHAPENQHNNGCHSPLETQSWNICISSICAALSK
jgi:hypothetical protein